LNHAGYEAQRNSSVETAALISDRWTLRILRECFLNVRRVESFQSRLKIRPAQLTERLDGLVSRGVLRTVCYQDMPRRYEYVLTEKGFDLRKIVLSLLPLRTRRWRSTGTYDRRSAAVRPELARIFDCIVVCPDCGEVLAKESTIGRRKEAPGWAPPVDNRFRAPAISTPVTSTFCD
jgi:DNA-binding HxlR family transcriptional regulator